MARSLRAQVSPELQRITGLHFTVQTLETLGSLTKVSADLSVTHTSILNGLAGLDALLSVGGNLAIGRNEQLTTLQGLGALRSVGGDVLIYENSKLRSLDGLEALLTVGMSLVINSNPVLTAVTGFPSLMSVARDLLIKFNQELVSVSPSALSQITKVGRTLDVLFSDGFAIRELKALQASSQEKVCRSREGLVKLRSDPVA